MAIQSTQNAVVRLSRRAGRRLIGSRHATLIRNSGSPMANRRTSHMPSGTTQYEASQRCSNIV